MAKLTVLRVSEKGKQAAKTICLGDDGQIKKINFNAGTWFHYSQRKVEGIKELSAFLLKLAPDNQALLIRGELAPWREPKEPVRRLGIKGHGQNGFFQSSPTGQPWILLDFDGIPAPSAIDFIKHPAQGVEYLASLLPSYFHGVSYHYHLSSSAGLDDGKTIRAHLWYWLDHSVTDDQLRIWAKGINCSGKLIDDSLFSVVHPHYTADPIFKGVVDPFPKARSGFVKAKSDAVAFPAISISHLAYSGSTDGLTPTEAFNKYLSAVGDHEGGMGFHEPLMKAAWYYVLENGVEGTDKEALKQKLKEVIAKADSSKHSPSEVAHKTSDSHLGGLIDSAIAKLSATGKTGKIEKLEPHYQHDKVVSAEEATKNLETLVKSYFSDPRHMAIKAGAGLGKTTQVIAGLAYQWQHGKRVELYLPTHKLADEVAGKLAFHPFHKGHFPWQPHAITGIEWQVIRGRHFLTEKGEPLCQKHETAKLLSERGLPVYPNLCRAGQHSCEYYSNCAYITQFNGTWHVRVYPHSYLGLDRGFLDKDLPDYAVIDESFFQVLLVGGEAKPEPEQKPNPKLKPISLAEIKAAGWPTELTKALVLAPMDKPLLSYLRDTLGEDGAIDCIDSAASEPVPPTKAGLIALPESEQLEIAASLKAKSRLDQFLAVLRSEMVTGRDEAHGISHDDDGFLLRYRRPINRFAGTNQGVAVTVPVLAIDADLTVDVHRQFFPSAEFHQIHTERNCHVVQSRSTKNSKTSLTMEAGAAKRISEIQSIIDRIAEERKLLVLGPQVVTGNLKASVSPKVTVPEGSVLDHFGAIKGVDSYKHLDAILVIGRNQPPVAGVEALARALWFDSDEPLILGIQTFIQKPRGYRTRSGYKVGVNVEVHPDPRVQMLLELVREAETLQGIDRLRLIHGKKKQVLLLSNLVLDLTVDNLISWAEMVEGTTKLTEAWNQLNGVLPLSQDWLSNQFPSIFPTENSAKDYFKSVGGELGEISNSILIRNLPQLRLYSYSLSGKSGPPRKCLSKYAEDRTKQRLFELLDISVKSISLVI